MTRFYATSNFILSGIALIAIVVLFNSCSKPKSNPAPATPVAITSLSATTGPYTTPVVITGTGFSTTVANNLVFFNGKAATITTATSTQLTVTVPLGAGTGNVTISVNNAAAVAGPVFTYQLSAFVSTLAGKVDSTGFADGFTNQALFQDPTDVVVDASDNVFVSDFGNGRIRKIDPIYTVVSTLAGGSSSVDINGLGTSATFVGPITIAIDSSRNIYVSESNSDLREITPAGLVTSFTPIISTIFNNIYGLAVNSTGTLIAASSSMNTIFGVGPTTLSTVAGSGVAGSLNAKGSAASFDHPGRIAMDPAGNIFVADSKNNLIREVTSDGTVSTLAGSGIAGSHDDTGTSATFNYPFGIAVDASDNVYVTELFTGLIRKITKVGVVTTLAGQVGSGGAKNGIGSGASFNNPEAIAVDSKGNLYIADTTNQLIRKITFQ